MFGSEDTQPALTGSGLRLNRLDHRPLLDTIWVPSKTAAFFKNVVLQLELGVVAEQRAPLVRFGPVIIQIDEEAGREHLYD